MTQLNAAPVSEREYLIRASVLNLTGKQWWACPGDYRGTATKFLESFGLPSGLSAKFNDQERDFFTEIYELNRRRSKRGPGDLSICPGCGGVADNGHDREMPPNVYLCSICTTKLGDSSAFNE